MRTVERTLPGSGQDGTTLGGQLSGSLVGGSELELGAEQSPKAGLQPAPQWSLELPHLIICQMLAPLAGNGCSDPYQPCSEQHCPYLDPGHVKLPPHCPSGLICSAVGSTQYVLPTLSESQLLTDGLLRRKSATPMPAEIAIEEHVSPDFAVTNFEHAFVRPYTSW